MITVDLRNETTLEAVLTGKVKVSRLCEHCDATGIEPHETSAYPPEPCSECNGRKRVNLELGDPFQGSVPCWIRKSPMVKIVHVRTYSESMYDRDYSLLACGHSVLSTPNAKRAHCWYCKHNIPVEA